MNPIYKFQLSDGTNERQAFPIYKDDLAIDYALEQNQEFYRGKLSGKLTFQRDDYAFIRNKPFDTQFYFVISISYNAGQTWAVYWSGQFWKTDCEFNEDEQTAIVTPTVNDRYNAVLDGMEKEYNLIELAPVIQPVKLDKRPMIQVYVPGQSVIGCFLSGMWWEQECNPVNDENALRNTYYFAENKRNRILDISQTGVPTLPDFVMGEFPATTAYFEMTKDGYLFRVFYHESTGEEDPAYNGWEIVRTSDNVRLWYFQDVGVIPGMPYSVTLSPVASGVTGTVTLYIHDVAVYSRYVTDVQSAMDVTAHDIPENDLVENNRNYHYVTPYNVQNTIFFNDVLSTTPTPWGIYQPGQYYVMYTNLAVSESFPVARSAWGRISLWFAFSAFDWLYEQNWRKEYTLKDAYPLWSVISVLLAQIAPGIVHEETTDYSQFIYGINPITMIFQKFYISPKSNLISAGYDQPAQKAPITLKRVLDMLRDCFRCYWFIDEQNRFRIEHISYFMNGGAYPGTPDFPRIGINLTEQTVSRNGKPWAYARSQYQFDKPEMASRYQFGWMDDVTQLFEGYPIDIISKYVNPENIEQIEIAQFTSDVDYILLNPGEISKDGFVLLLAQYEGGEYKLRYENFVIGGTNHVLQNAWAAFIFLQRYYMYDMPAPNVKINGEWQLVHGVKKLKTQTIKFPVIVEPEEMFNLVKTELGDGTIQKMSVNLSSRNANTTLKYDTE